jgi:hypothetical protein
MTGDPAFILANLVNQRQAANYGSIIELLVSRGIVTLEEVRRARLRAEAAVDQVTAGDNEALAATPAGEMLLELLGKMEDCDDDDISDDA